MLKNVAAVVLKAKNCYNAYSPDVPGCLATGRSVTEALEKLRRVLGNQIRHLLDQGETYDEPEAAVMLAVDVPEATPESAAQDPPQALRRFRENRKLTQAQFARMIEVTQETISEWERGRRRIPGAVRMLVSHK